MVSFAVAILVMGALGYMQVRTQNRLRGQMTQLPDDARRRMRTVFPAVMGGILVLFFVAIFLLRPHA